jgi:peptidyl-prolyl cis-trans isomerase B (cyclophilin B)
MIKKLVLMLLLLSVSVFAVSCSDNGEKPSDIIECDEHTDEDGDKYCDVCDERIKSSKPSSNRTDKFKVTHHVTMEIANYGTVHIDLYGKEAPITVANFVKLVNKGYYDGTTFHRIISGFMAQGGAGADTAPIVGEFESNGVDNDIQLSRGAIAMARSYIPNSATSQFFIVQDTEGADHLNGDYAGFGRVTNGMSVIDAICNDARPYDNNGSILPQNQPIITKITVRGECDLCDRELHEKCVDYDDDGKCDVCKGEGGSSDTPNLDGFGDGVEGPLIPYE